MPKSREHYIRKIVNNSYISKDGCWEWVKCKNKDGYGQTGYLGKSYGVHHVVMILTGRFKEGYVTDHICKNRSCCNPDHLRLVTERFNILNKNSNNVAAKNLRKTHCKNGHEFTPENTMNTIAYGKPRRYCRTCKRKATARHRQKFSPSQNQSPS